MCVATCVYIIDIFYVVNTVTELSEQYSDLHEVEDTNPYEDLWTVRNFMMQPD